MLIETARRANERVIREEVGWTYDALCAIAFSALAIEALANAFGERKVEGWSDIESASPIAKLRVLSLALDLKYDADAEPWRTVRWLVKVRNLVAHAKPQFIREERLLTQEEVGQRQVDRPESKIEREITKENSERAVRAATRLKDMLCASISPEETMGLITDGWSGFTSSQE
jgi:hypothetical protein